jgi:hypothetical protein
VPPVPVICSVRTVAVPADAGGVGAVKTASAAFA